MIIGLGIDTVELTRIERIYDKFGTVFSQKILHPNEYACLHGPQPYTVRSKIIAYLASRFAAKEAAVKALGTGFTQGIGLHDIEVSSLANGKPVVHFYGNALKQKKQLQATHAHISLTHSKDSASAVVILERSSDT